MCRLASLLALPVFSVWLGHEVKAEGFLATQSLTLRALYSRATRQPDGTLQLELQGAVELLYGGRSLRTERLQVDTAQARVRGETPFELIAPEGHLRGQRLEYFYEQRRGRFSQVEAILYPLAGSEGRVSDSGAGRHSSRYLSPTTHPPPLRLWAQEMAGDLQQFEAQRVRATVCERDPPDFTVEAERVRLLGGERLRLFNARLRWKGRTLLRLPTLTLRLRERRETLELPTPTYSPDTGLGARYQWELPLGERALLALHGAFYGHAVPETRLALAVALTGDMPTLMEPELSQRLEASTLYNLRITPDRERTALHERTTTLRIEHASNIRPLLGREAHLRVSRPFEIALSTGFALGEGAGGLTLRVGKMREHTPTQRRLALEAEWLQPLMHRPFELNLHLWASHVRYESNQRLDWLRPQIEISYQPSERFRLMLGYAFAQTTGSTPFVVDRPVARNELALRGEGQWGNLRLGALLKYDLNRQQLYDVQLLLGWRQHCIEPFLYWRREPSVLLMGVSLTGLP
ncbi:LPS-assembly protein LptD [bacterium HR15]|nr:LPS-assembly protein LptD [bacterium HR15]